MTARADLAPPKADPPETDSPETDSPADFVLTFGKAELAEVQAAYAAATTILEYGSGGSTVLGADQGKRVISVESDKAWAEALARRVTGRPGAVTVHHADIGPTGAWGFPARAKCYDRFHGYALSVWDRPDFTQPDLVLVDGRFRAACLAATLMRTRTPVTLLFDDYAKRGYYHAVERLVLPQRMAGRMAVFTVAPGTIPPDMLTEVIGWFTDPR